MTADLPRIYLDANVLLSYVNDAPERADVVQSLLARFTCLPPISRLPRSPTSRQTRNRATAQMMKRPLMNSGPRTHRSSSQSSLGLSHTGRGQSSGRHATMRPLVFVPPMPFTWPPLKSTRATASTHTRVRADATAGTLSFRPMSRNPMWTRRASPVPTTEQCNASTHHPRYAPKCAGRHACQDR